MRRVGRTERAVLPLLDGVLSMSNDKPKPATPPEPVSATDAVARPTTGGDGMICDVCGETWEFCDEVAAGAPSLTQCQGYLERRASDARHQARLDRQRALEAIEAAARAFRHAVDQHVMEVAPDGEAEYGEAGARLDAALDALRGTT